MNLKCSYSTKCNLFIYLVIFISRVNSFDINLKGKHGKGYYIDVEIGNPPQKFQMVVDTGSTNFAIASSENNITDSYFIASNSSSFSNISKNVCVQYAQGSWSGSLGIDLVKFPTLNSNVLTKTEISLILKSNDFFMNNSNWQGILGLAYPSISRPDHTTLSWIDEYQKQNNLSFISFSLELCGTRGGEDHFGALQILDESPFLSNDSLLIAPLVRNWYYEITLTNIMVNEHEISVSCTDLNNDKTIIDSGTTNLRLPYKVFDKLVALLYNFTVENKIPLTETFWDPYETSCFDSPRKWNMLPNISLSIAMNHSSYFSIELTGSSYIRRVFENSDETSPLKYCYKIAIEKSDMGTTLGVVALEGFKLIFNRTAQTVGFLRGECGPVVGIHGPYITNSSFKQCIQKNRYVSNHIQCDHTNIIDNVHVANNNIIAITIFTIALLLLILMLVPLSRWFLLKRSGIPTPSLFLTWNRTQLLNED